MTVHQPIPEKELADWLALAKSADAQKCPTCDGDGWEIGEVEFEGHEPRYGCNGCGESGVVGTGKNQAWEFIVLRREAVPRLIADLRSARAALDLILRRMPKKPKPDPKTGENEMTWIGTGAPIWDAIEKARAQLPKE